MMAEGMQKDGTQSETTLTADDILGPYEKIRVGLRPLNMSTTGYLPNPSEIAVADTWHGPYTVLGNPHPGVKVDMTDAYFDRYLDTSKSDYVWLPIRFDGEIPRIDGWMNGGYK